MGGEEFCVLLANIGTDAELFEVTERVRLAIAVIKLDEFPTVSVTASVGAMRVRVGQPVVEALRHADQATYRAKADGRNRVEVFAQVA
jgi:diguanylate cyclase (GGDEF)-like protein